MPPSSELSDVAVSLHGAAGGLIAVLVAWTAYSSGEAKKSPAHRHPVIYWVVQVGWVALGAYFAYLFNSDQPITRLNATQIGMLAPLLVARIFKTAELRKSGSVDSKDEPDGGGDDD